MKISSSAAVFLLSISAASVSAGRGEFTEYYKKLGVCCDDGCKKSCDWLEENPEILRMGAPRNLRLTKPDEEPLLSDEKVKGLCCSKPPPQTGGDPHFTMFNGHKFDFHGACDLVFLDNPDYNKGQGMRIHMRTKAMHWWSYVQSVVVQIGEDTLEFMGGVGESKYWVNGEPGAKLENSGVQPFTIGGHSVRYRVLGENKYQFKIFLENGQEIVLKSLKDFMKVELPNHTKESFGSSKGILGSYEGGEMLARDGTTIIEDPNEFGLEWQVRQEEPMIFHDVEGVQHPMTCAMPKTTQRQLSEQSINREEAERACLHAESDSLEDCIFDVMATEDMDLAGAY